MALGWYQAPSECVPSFGASLSFILILTLILPPGWTQKWSLPAPHPKHPAGPSPSSKNLNHEDFEAGNSKMRL